MSMQHMSATTAGCGDTARCSALHTLRVWHGPERSRTRRHRLTGTAARGLLPSCPTAFAECRQRFCEDAVEGHRSWCRQSSFPDFSSMPAASASPGPAGAPAVGCVAATGMRSRKSSAHRGTPFISTPRMISVMSCLSSVDMTISLAGALSRSSSAAAGALVTAVALSLSLSAMSPPFPSTSGSPSSREQSEAASLAPSSLPSPSIW
mmetsp:Transcript_13124/g.38579  ORF Transcript_13124/g.38579 Transcript_13124/m.38579 type:complete len:207 (-) Transcript_13124:153-773(-)